jgi:hypothetical protein
MNSGGTGEGEGDRRRRMRPGVAVAGFAIGLIFSALTVIQHRHDHVPIVVLILFAVIEPPFVLGFLGLVGWLYGSDATGSAWRGRRTGALAPQPMAAPGWAPPRAPDGGWRWRGGVNAPPLVRLVP